MLPITTTKVGPGDKTKAYVVRQNVALKAILCTIILVLSLGALVCHSAFEVSVQRRHSLHNAREHREEEHSSHMRVMHLSILLQRHLEDDVNDVSYLTSYRAWLVRTVGDYQAEVLAAVNQNCSAAPERVQTLGLEFDQKLEGLMKGLWKDVLREGQVAKKELHNITHAIMTELKEDAAEASDFDKIMREAGYDAGTAGFHHHHEDTDNDGKEDDDGAPPDDDEDEDEDDDGEDEDEDYMEHILESLYSRLLENSSHAVTHLDENVTLMLQEKYEHYEMELEDSESEPDMQRIDQAIDAMLLEVQLPAFNESSQNVDNRLEYLEVLVAESKLSRHKEELVKLLAEWQAGDTQISVPLARIEELIDEDELPSDLLRSDDDYKYD